MHQRWNCPVLCGGIHKKKKKNAKNSDFDPKKQTKKQQIDRIFVESFGCCICLNDVYIYTY